MLGIHGEGDGLLVTMGTAMYKDADGEWSPYIIEVEPRYSSILSNKKEV